MVPRGAAGSSREGCTMASPLLPDTDGDVCLARAPSQLLPQAPPAPPHPQTHLWGEKAVSKGYASLWSKVARDAPLPRGLGCGEEEAEVSKKQRSTWPGPLPGGKGSHASLALPVSPTSVSAPTLGSCLTELLCVPTFQLLFQTRASCSSCLFCLHLLTLLPPAGFSGFS